MIELQDVEDIVKGGADFWKLNCIVPSGQGCLNDKEYVNELNLLLPTWI